MNIHYIDYINFIMYYHSSFDKRSFEHHEEHWTFIAAKIVLVPHETFAHFVNGHFYFILVRIITPLLHIQWHVLHCITALNVTYKSGFAMMGAYGFKCCCTLMMETKCM